MRKMRARLNSLVERYDRQSGWRRWSGSLLVGLILGVVVMPWLIYLAGRSTLGAYANGGPFALWGDFFRGLFDLSAAYWIAALGPCVAILALLLWRNIRG
jgi:hypothetical protein